LVGQSPTGSGKTAAFGIPLVERLDPAIRAVQAIIICPTRELAVQVAGELHKLVAFKPGISVIPVYGGAAYDRQVQGIRRGAQVVIGTPGRMLDHIRRGTLSLENARTAVLDEADEMLDMGFREDIEAILSELSTDRQTVLFSATMPKAIREMTAKFTKDPVTVTVAHEMLNAPDIEQVYYEIGFRSKPEVLSRLLDTHESRLTIVFCNTKRTVDDVTENLVARGFGADRLHGDVSQMVRTRVMSAFRKGVVTVLVATDVAARGLDVDDVGLVINYDLPYDAEDYVHRIGRTGRMGKSGRAVSLVAGRDVYKLQTIQRHTKQKVTRFQVPTIEELEEHRTDRFYGQLRELLVK
ncbi:MAG: DEAD/DEAH box helicase, partial [Verrucomicrobiales bacterium]